MKNHDVLFDHMNKKIGFAEANCSWYFNNNLSLTENDVVITN